MQTWIFSTVVTPNAVVTYICDYYSKDEIGVTDVFKQVVKQQADQRKSVHDMLRLLKVVYLTHRQNGACEATYRLLPSLHLKDSNITSVFLTTGFPENRYQFLKWIEDQDTQQDTVEIESREGKYVWTMTVHEKYSKRPSSLDDICLAEFVINYTSAPRDASETNNDECKTKRSLPSKVTLEDNGGIMRLREVPCVLRLHESRKKLKITNSYIQSVCCTCPGKMKKSYIVIHLKHQLNYTKTKEK